MKEPAVPGQIWYYDGVYYEIMEENDQVVARGWGDGSSLEYEIEDISFLEKNGRRVE